jgi:hypothetical protein
VTGRVLTFSRGSGARSRGKGSAVTVVIQGIYLQDLHGSTESSA